MAALTGLEEYALVLVQRDEDGEPYTLVGGQAVNFWAKTYRQREPRLEAFAPFLSKDLDLLATTAQGEQIARATGWEFIPPEPEAINVQGKLRQGTLEVEFLAAQGRPLLPPEHGCLLLSEGSPAVPVKVVSPELLLVMKVALAVTVPQDGSVSDIAARQDVRHVRILALVVPHYFADLLARFSDDSARVSAVQPSLAVLASVRRSANGRRFEEVYPGVLHWGELLPPEMRTLPFDPVYQRSLEQLDARSV